LKIKNKGNRQTNFSFGILNNGRQEDDHGREEEERKKEQKRRKRGVKFFEISEKGGPVK
jgi:hypothetical protein